MSEMEVEDLWEQAEKLVSEELSDHTRAVKLLKDAVKLSRERNDDEALVLSLVRLGDRYRGRQQWEEARAAYEEAAPKFTQFFGELSLVQSSLIWPSFVFNNFFFFFFFLFLVFFLR